MFFMLRFQLGVIAHEVAHALGFWHEQSRPDRDGFVDVVWRNIDQGSLGQFLKEQPDDVDNEGISYDYGSVMHYRSSKSFAVSWAGPGHVWPLEQSSR